MTKKTVLIKGPLLVNSGYGVHARQIARWLFEKEDRGEIDVYCELTRWGDCGWITDLGEFGSFNRRIVQASTKPTKPFYDVAMSVMLPTEWEAFRAITNIGITAGIEADRCPMDWITACNQMSLVVVPSKFASDSLTFVDPTGSKTRPKTEVVVVPECFPDEVLDSTTPPLDIDFQSPFNFLVVGQFTGNNPENDRKNLPHTIRMFLQTFAGRKDVGLVLKTGFARQHELDRLLTTNILKKLVFEVNQNNGSSPNIHLIHGNLTNKEMVGLYKHPKIKALLSLGHGEGFGLPILEAAACGLPVIATDWSAYTEFLRPRNKNDSWLSVPANVHPVHETRNDNLFVNGACWATPDEQQAKLRMSKFFGNDSIPRKWAKNQADSLKETHSFRAISKELDKAIKW